MLSQQFCLDSSPRLFAWPQFNSNFSGFKLCRCGSRSSFTSQTQETPWIDPLGEWDHNKRLGKHQGLRQNTKHSQIHLDAWKFENWDPEASIGGKDHEVGVSLGFQQFLLRWGVGILSKVDSSKCAVWNRENCGFFGVQNELPYFQGRTAVSFRGCRITEKTVNFLDDFESDFVQRALIWMLQRWQDLVFCICGPTGMEGSFVVFPERRG